jgi:hypothetical protein
MNYLLARAALRGTPQERNVYMFFCPSMSVLYTSYLDILGWVSEVHGDM